MEKNKKDKKTNVLLGISVAVNIILAIVFLAVGGKAVDELKFSYVEVDTITPDTIRSNLERENYGVAACLSHPIRGGAKVADEDLDYYYVYQNTPYQWGQILDEEKRKLASKGLTKKLQTEL